jgi:hypothetical protein
MRSSDFPGALAGFSVAFVGFLILHNSADPCGSTLTERSSYIGGISVTPQDIPRAAPQSEDAVNVDNPYGLQTCDYWSSPGEKWLGVLGFAVISLLGGATAARIGTTIAPWRGSLAVGTALGGVVLYALASTREPIPIGEILVWTAPHMVLAAIVGGIGGALAKRLA